MVLLFPSLSEEDEEHPPKSGNKREGRTSHSMDTNENTCRGSFSQFSRINDTPQTSTVGAFFSATPAFTPFYNRTGTLLCPRAEITFTCERVCVCY